MSVTCCPLQEGDESPSESTSEVILALEDLKCGECGEVIISGTAYENFEGCWGDVEAGDPWDVHRTCLSCVEIRNHFACNGWVFGEVWNDIEQNFFPDMKAGGPCMEGLSPAAKGRLFERRLAWLEERND